MGSALCADHEGTTGADWRRWDRVVRLVYVRAVADMSNTLIADRAITYAKASNPYIPKRNVKIGDLVDAIDKFYATPENRPIDILAAMTIVRDKFNGASDNCIAEEVLQARMGRTKLWGKYDTPLTF